MLPHLERRVRQSDDFAGGVVFYPRVDRAPAEAFGAATLGLLTGHILSWRQGAGAFGGLHLHACWGVVSSLSRRYHGPTISSLSSLLQSMQMLANRSGDLYWRHMADSVAAEMLWLQMPGGGFCHASSENEPIYDSYWSCPLHQMNPVIALLDYYEQQPPDAPIRVEIRRVLARHMEWFNRFWWKRGNDWKRPLRTPGWCGVANQDLTAVAAMACYGRVLGDWQLYESHGIPVLETIIGAGCYHSNLGGGERGDRANFTERSNDLRHIARLLKLIHEVRPDQRLPVIIARMVEALADGIFSDENGRYHVAWGLDDRETARVGRRVWDRSRFQICDYPAMIEFMESYPGDLSSHRVEECVNGLRATLASYVFGDGTIPSALDPSMPLFAVTPSSHALCEFWQFLIRCNPKGLSKDDISCVPSVIRQCGFTTYVSSQDNWMLTQAEVPAIRGIKRLTHAVLRPGEEWPNCDFNCPADPEIKEEVRLSEERFAR